jgi:hypothetical protein
MPIGAARSGRFFRLWGKRQNSRRLTASGKCRKLARRFFMGNIGLPYIVCFLFTVFSFFFFIARIAFYLRNPSLSAAEKSKMQKHLIIASIAAVIGIGSLVFCGVLLYRLHFLNKWTTSGDQSHEALGQTDNFSRQRPNGRSRR